MKNHFLAIQLFSILILSIIVFNACNQKKDSEKTTIMNIGYNVRGINESVISDIFNPISKTNSRYNYSGENRADRSVLYNPDSLLTKSWVDSIKRTKIGKGGKTLCELIKASSTFQTDTFYLLDQSGEFSEFVFVGKTKTNVLRINMPIDSFKYEIKGFFQDTILIENVKNEDSEKKAYHIIHKVLHKNIHEGILKYVKELKDIDMHE